MKTLRLLILLMVVTTYSFGQKIYFGGGLAPSTTWLLNKQVSDDGDEQDYAISGSLRYGLMAGVKLTDAIGVELGLYMGSHNQKYEGTYNLLNLSYTSKTTLKTIDIPLMLKFGEKVYFELGPVFTMINSATFESEVNGGNTNSTSVSGDFKKSSIGAAIGVGGDIEITKSLFINLGFRGSYGLGDIEGVNALGATKDEVAPDEKSNFKTNTIIGTFLLGVKYQIGR